MRYYFLNEKYTKMNPLKKYIWLVDTLMRAGDTGLTIKQVSDAYEFDDEISGGEKYNGRTFHRHRKEVKDIFGIEIECYQKGADFRYRIADSGDNDYFRRWLMDSIAVNRVISDSMDTARYIGIENTNAEHLPSVLQALKEQRKVEFDYKPYWADTPTHYFDFQPHAVKMFERRWYLIGRYKKDMPYIILALDRISQFELKEETFRRDPDFNLEEMFDHPHMFMRSVENPPRKGCLDEFWESENLDNDDTWFYHTYLLKLYEQVVVNGTFVSLKD